MVYLCASKLIQLGKIRVGIVNYLNTLPLRYGLAHGDIARQIELVQGYPSQIADDLDSGRVDLALVPVGVLPKLHSYKIETDYGIASNGPVASVCLFSEVPLEEVREVLLDYQSRTSSLLLKLLFRDFWKKEVQYIETTTDFTDEIRASRAGLLIGDRCLAYRPAAKYTYDLGDSWKQHTGLPFVFAVWASNRPLPASFMRDFNSANANGVAAIDHLIAESIYPHYDLEKYFKENIRYHLDPLMHQGLERFLKDIASIGR